MTWFESQPFITLISNVNNCSVMSSHIQRWFAFFIVWDYRKQKHVFPNSLLKQSHRTKIRKKKNAVRMRKNFPAVDWGITRKTPVSGKKTPDCLTTYPPDLVQKNKVVEMSDFNAKTMGGGSVSIITEWPPFPLSQLQGVLIYSKQRHFLRKQTLISHCGVAWL